MDLEPPESDGACAAIAPAVAPLFGDPAESDSRAGGLVAGLLHEMLIHSAGLGCHDDRLRILATPGQPIDPAVTVATPLPSERLLWAMMLLSRDWIELELLNDRIRELRARRRSVLAGGARTLADALGSAIAAAEIERAHLVGRLFARLTTAAAA